MTSTAPTTTVVKISALLRPLAMLNDVIVGIPAGIESILSDLAHRVRRALVASHGRKSLKRELSQRFSRVRPVPIMIAPVFPVANIGLRRCPGEPAHSG
jgi:hypothetical protein